MYCGSKLTKSLGRTKLTKAGSAHTRGLVPATSRRDKSHHVNWSFLLQNLVTGTNFSPCDKSHKFKPVRIFGKSPCDLFLKTLCVNC